MAFSAGVAAKVARFSLTICHGGSVGGKSGQRRNLAPDFGRKRFARTLDESVGVADGHREAVGIGEQPFVSPLTTPKSSADQAAGQAEVRVDNGAEFVGRSRPGRSSRATQGGTADHAAASRPSASAPLSKSSATARSPRTNSRTRSPKRTVRTAAARKASAGSMKHCERPRAATSGRHARPPCARVSRRSCGGERGGAFRRLGVQAGEQERPPQPLIERSLARHRLADRLRRWRRSNMASGAKYSRKPVPGARLVRSSSHQGMRPSFGRTASARRSADRRNRTRAAPGPRRGSSDADAARDSRARHHCRKASRWLPLSMTRPSGLVEVGSAAAAGGVRRLVHDDLDVRPRRGAPRRSGRRRRRQRHGRSSRSQQAVAKKSAQKHAAGSLWRVAGAARSRRASIRSSMER